MKSKFNALQGIHDLTSSNQESEQITIYILNKNNIKNAQVKQNKIEITKRCTQKIENTTFKN